jgi:hypothetical protein
VTRMLRWPRCAALRNSAALATSRAALCVATASTSRRLAASALSARAARRFIGRVRLFGHAACHEAMGSGHPGDGRCRMPGKSACGTHRGTFRRLPLWLASRSPRLTDAALRCGQQLQQLRHAHSRRCVHAPQRFERLGSLLVLYLRSYSAAQNTRGWSSRGEHGDANSVCWLARKANYEMQLAQTHSLLRCHRT